MSLRTLPSKTQVAHTVFDFQDVFRVMPEACILFEAVAPAYTIVEMNSAREILLGVPREACIGKPLFEAYPDLRPYSHGGGSKYIRKSIERVVATGKEVRLETFRYDLPNEAGVPQVHYWRSTYVPLRAAGAAEVTHIVATTKDVTEEVEASRRIANIESRLEAALSIGQVGSWLWDIETDTVVGDKNLAFLFGIGAERVTHGVPLEVFLQAVHDMDRSRVRRVMRRCAKQENVFEEEYRTAETQGKMRWVLARGRVEVHDSKKVLAGVIVDVTERRDMQAQIALAHEQDKLSQERARILQERNDELERISRSKDEFVALASHQLRTPATAVKQYLGMVLQGYAGDITSEQNEMLEKAFQSNERQIQIVNQILNAARVDTGRLVLARTPLDIVNLARGVAADMQAAFSQRNHKVRFYGPKEAIWLRGDQGYMRMAVENLVHNACIYTPNGGSICVRVRVRGAYCLITVADTGVGIAKADVGKLFTKFSRALASFRSCSSSTISTCKSVSSFFTIALFLLRDL